MIYELYIYESSVNVNFEIIELMFPMVNSDDFSRIRKIVINDFYDFGRLKNHHYEPSEPLIQYFQCCGLRYFHITAHIIMF